MAALGQRSALVLGAFAVLLVASASSEVFGNERAAGALADAHVHSGKADADNGEEEGRKPVGKVVRILKSMVEELEKEADSDEDQYEAIKCWCETNKKEKTKAIEDNTDRVGQLKEQFQQLRGRVHELDTSIGSLSKENKANSEAYAKALDMRKKQLAEFKADERELMASVASLNGAAAMLKNHGSDAMLQDSSDAVDSVAKALKKALHKHTAMVLQGLSEQQMKGVWDFLHDPQTFLRGEGGSEAEAARPLTANLQQAEQDGEAMWTGVNSKAQAPPPAPHGTPEAAIAMAFRVEQSQQSSVTVAAKTPASNDDDDLKLPKSAFDQRDGENAEDEDDVESAAPAPAKPPLHWSWSEFALVQRARLANETAQLRPARLRQKVASLVQSRLNSQVPHDMIKGVLNKMRSTFQKNLEKAQQDEDKQGGEFMNLKKTKKKVIKRTGEQLDVKTEEIADVKENAAQARQDQVDTEEVLEADMKFMPKLKAKCENLDSEYAARTRMRQQETMAVNKALEFLTSDEAKDLFRKQHDNFMQREATSSSRAKVKKVSKYLASLAGRTGDLELASLALSMRARGAADAIKSNMLKMIDNLVVKKGEDMAKKDFCTDEINKNDRAWELKSREIEVRTDDKVHLEEKIKDLEREIKEGLDTRAEELKQLKRVGEDRQKANTMFQRTVSDHHASMRLLGKAMDVLKAFYKKASKEAAMLREHAIVKRSVDAIPVGSYPRKPSPPRFVIPDLAKTVARDLKEIKKKPIMLRVATVVSSEGEQPSGLHRAPGFKKGGPSPSGNVVLTLIDTIIRDTSDMVNEATKDEMESQRMYESFVNEHNDRNSVLYKKILDMQVIVSKQKVALSELKKRIAELHDQWKELRQKDIDLHGIEGCDWLMRNYDVRQEAYGEEIEGLKVGMYALGDMEGLGRVMEANGLGGDGSDEKPPGGDGRNPDGMLPTPTEGEAEESGAPEDAAAGTGALAGSEVAVVPEGLEIFGPQAERAVLSTR